VLQNNPIIVKIFYLFYAINFVKLFIFSFSKTFKVQMMKRGLLSDFADLDEYDIGFPVKRHCSVAPSINETFGPIPIQSFNSQLFPPNAMVYVSVPVSSVCQVFAMPLNQGPAPTSFVPLPTEFEGFFEEQREDNQFLDNKGTGSASGAGSGTASGAGSGTASGNVLLKEKCKIKLSTLDILELKAVFLYNPQRACLPSGIRLESIPDKKNKKRRISNELLNHPLCWNGLAVSTFLKNDKNNLSENYIFTDKLVHLAQYVRPMGFSPGKLVLPSNAICYTSFNKGNHQVTYILTDMFVFNDVKKALEKHRFSYGMTILKKFQKPQEVQFCFMILLALAFHLFRTWCRANACTKTLIDASFKEPTFEEMCDSIMVESSRHLSSKLLMEDMSFLLERADTLFKKLVQLCVTLYPQ
jgi:hypothetical protein